MATNTSRLIFKPELRQKVGLSYTTIWNLMRQDRFPRSVIVTDGRVAWHEEEVDEWIQTLPRQRLKGDSAKPSKAISTAEIEQQEIGSSSKDGGPNHEKAEPTSG